MSRPVEVRLPLAAAAMFPDACCNCLRTFPGERLSVHARELWLLELRMPSRWFSGGDERWHAPICAACRPAAARQRTVQTVLLLAVFAGLVVVLQPWISELDTESGNKIGLGAAVGVMFLAAAKACLHLRPPAFDVRLRRDEVVYRFRNVDYGRLFLHANGAAGDEAGRGG